MAPPSDAMVECSKRDEADAASFKRIGTRRRGRTLCDCGAMAATFYVEPLLTFDLDVFIILHKMPAICRSTRRCARVVTLLEEALREARETLYEEVPARVVRAEHLIAICLQTRRDKNRERVRILREQADLDMNYLAEVLQRHGLEGKWKPWMP
jgi:hypothetical protein